KIRPGVETKEVHETVQKFFESQGFKTGKKHGRMQGFFHGTGHGLGLEIHESPRMGTHSTGRLKPGQVVTVEPGLYYPEIGGVRLEDVALITKTKPRNLTRFETGATPPFGGAYVPAPNSTAIPNWTVSSGSVDYIGSDTWQAADGSRSLDMSGHDAGTIMQNVSGFTVGQQYRLSFYLAGNN